MWGIGKLEGRELEIAGFKASSSQLYTGLICVAVPLGFLASPISTILWLIGFFWGGGLVSRPRSPKFTPQWGRLTRGGQQSRRRGPREREKSFLDKPLSFGVEDSIREIEGAFSVTGRRPPNKLNLHSGLNTVTNYSRDNFNQPIEILSDLEDSDTASNSELDLLQDVKEALIATALARIRRAKEKGKREVNLTKGELAALEKRRRLMEAAAIANSKREKKRRSIAVPLSSPMISQLQNDQAGFFGSHSQRNGSVISFSDISDNNNY
ncbi:hypothetical protein K3495_g5686 [Podosphaera aphanis]|nr:hypothetical protein K3495_g5686 [Podosphaera aphanis]